LIDVDQLRATAAARILNVLVQTRSREIKMMNVLRGRIRKNNEQSLWMTMPFGATIMIASWPANGLYPVTSPAEHCSQARIELAPNI
jgi:hypothetical protein